MTGAGEGPRMRLPKGRDDQGFSLIEVVVTTGVMSVVMVVVLTAVIQIFSGAKEIDQTSVVRDQFDIGFRRLDRELRYATWTSEPKKVGTTWYLEYALPPVKDVGGQLVYPCRQLTLAPPSADSAAAADGDVLALGSWNLPATKPASRTTIATGVTAPATGPVTLNAPGAAPYATASAGTVGVGIDYEPRFLQFWLRFTVRSGTVTLPFDSVFTSLNIDVEPAKQLANDCRLGRP